MSTNATLPQAGHVLTLIAEKGVTKEQLAKAVNDGTLPDFLEAIATGVTKSREELRSFLGLGPLVLSIIVDYMMSLEQMIAAGRYNWKNDYINKKTFPRSDKGKGRWEREVELIHFNRVISSDDAEKELDKMGLRPATIEELLFLGSAFPEMQRKFPIIALGSVTQIDGGRCVACLSGSDSVRGLALGWRDDGWGGFHRFLAVRK